MQSKRMTLFAGHYGSGKTNIAVNYALYLKSLGENVVIADLDIVNPYFRTRDSLEELNNAGIKLISSAFANSNVDLPALPQDVYSLLDKRDEKAIMDIGGDDRGAYALGRYADAIKEVKSALEQSKINNNNWLETLDTPIETDGVSYLRDCIQDYFAQFLETDNLPFAEKLADVCVELYPKEAIFLTDKGTARYYAGDLQGAAEWYLKAQTIP